MWPFDIGRCQDKHCSANKHKKCGSGYCVEHHMRCQSKCDAPPVPSNETYDELSVKDAAWFERQINNLQSSCTAHGLFIAGCWILLIVFGGASVVASQTKASENADMRRVVRSDLLILDAGSIFSSDEFFDSHIPTYIELKALPDAGFQFTEINKDGATINTYPNYYGH